MHDEDVLRSRPSRRGAVGLLETREPDDDGKPCKEQRPQEMSPIWGDVRRCRGATDKVHDIFHDELFPMFEIV
jgi:hypothetical protein